MKTKIMNVTIDNLTGGVGVTYMNENIRFYSEKNTPETVKKFIESAEKRIDGDFIRYERAYNENDYL